MSKVTRRSGRKAKLQEAPNAPSGQTSRKPSKSEHAEAPQKRHSSLQKEKAKPLHATPEQTAIQRPNTPERQHKQVTKDLESTPHSHGSSSFTSTLPPGRKYHVDEANKYLLKYWGPERFGDDRTSGRRVGGLSSKCSTQEQGGKKGRKLLSVQDYILSI
ncbi:hypothetical protein F5050DRAFT_281387 [Lentinula boryana]|uniref:Uncharacterized protein n=1 Tax=Lentinula boryana TaxID=40481 RepID=A0ABQ8QQY1_9AGAR|nr:hypothetical protein F5050DRAFT_281387 [Lentinula boryana]